MQFPFPVVRGFSSETTDNFIASQPLLAPHVT
jgi:hypothetical protein